MRIVDAFEREMQRDYMIEVAREARTAISAYPDSLGNSVRLDLLREYCCLFLYLIGYWIKVEVPSPSGVTICDKFRRDCLSFVIDVACSDWESELVDFLRRESLTQMNDRFAEFDTFDHARPAGQESLAGTLFWEFGKLVAIAIGDRHDLSEITFAQQNAVNSLSRLAPREFAIRVGHLADS